MKSTELLREQHRKTKKNFDRALNGGQRQQILRVIADELAAHMRLEEEIFYPLVQEALRDHELIPEAREEHVMASIALARALQGAEAETLEARVKVLSELVRHHIEEEEKEVFPEIEKALGRERSEEIAAQMEERFGELLEVGHAALLEKYPQVVDDGGPSASSGRASRGGAKKRARSAGSKSRRAAGARRPAAARSRSSGRGAKKNAKKKTRSARR